MDRPRHILDHDFLKGGPGSGNFGHGGRPGERGGSTPKGGASNKMDPARLKNPQETVEVDSDESATHAEKLRPLADAAFSKLHEGSKESLKHYTQYGYFHLNRYLRGEKDVSPGPYLEHANNIQTAIDTAGHLPEPTTVWRGVETYHPGDAEALAQKFQSQIGKTINMKGFQSATLYKEEALRFSRSDPKENAIVFRINTQKGLPINGHTATGSGDEGEVLLGHNWKYRVKDAKLVTFKVKNRSLDSVGTTKRVVVDLEVEQ